MFKAENISDTEIEKLLNQLSCNKPLLNISVELTTRNGNVHQSIISNITGEKKLRDDFNGYEKSLINTCLNDYMFNKNNCEKYYIKKIY